jgi:hypothetical protein
VGQNHSGGCEICDVTRAALSRGGMTQRSQESFLRNLWRRNWDYVEIIQSSGL